MKSVDILVSELQGDINLGSILRLMENFGAGDLHLVKPRCPRGEDAKNFSCRAAHRLETIRYWDDFQEATSQDHDLILATTARHGKDRQVLSLHELPSLGERLQGRVLLVFGREDRGLYHEEVARCHTSVHIPLPDAYPALNLSHAVSIVLYELHRLRNPDQRKPDFEGIANVAEVQALENSIHDFLNSFGYFEKPERRREPEELSQLLRSHPYRSDQIRFVQGLLRAWRNRR